MQMTLDLNKQARPLRLGNILLEAEHFSLRTEAPMRERILTDGTVKRYLLTDTACTLRVSGRMEMKNAAAYLGQLGQYLNRHTALAVNFMGINFLDLQLTQMDINDEKYPGMLAYAISMTGKIGGTAA